MRRERLRRLEAIEARLPERRLDMSFLSGTELRALEALLIECALQGSTEAFLPRVRLRFPRMFLQHGDNLRALLGTNIRTGGNTDLVTFRRLALSFVRASGLEGRATQRGGAVWQLCPGPSLHLPQDRTRIRVERGRNLNELNNFNASLTSLTLRDETLRPTKALRQLLLSKARFLPSTLQSRKEQPVSSAPKGLQGRAPK